MDNATLEWDLLYTDGTTILQSNRTVIVTPNNGEVLIQLAIDPSDAEFPESVEITHDSMLLLRIRPRKTSEGDFHHTFLCDNEDSICPVDGHITYLSHLEFGKGVQFTDSTVIQMSGQVTIGQVNYRNTEGFGKIEDGVKTTGCPLTGVEVCLHRKATATSATDSGEENDPSVECKETGEVFLFPFS